MSYPTRFDEITEKLNRLKNGGGVTRPLVPEGGGSAAIAAQAKKYDELAELIKELKTDFNLFRRETALALKEISGEIKSLSLPSDKKPAASDLKGGDADESFGDILDELSALKQQIKSALDIDK